MVEQAQTISETAASEVLKRIGGSVLECLDDDEETLRAVHETFAAANPFASTAT